ncbi:hypothetical protein Tco_0084790 [Tanacetum coccineum]
MQHPIPNPRRHYDPTTAMNIGTSALMAKAFNTKLPTPQPTTNQRISSQTLESARLLNRYEHGQEQISCGWLEEIVGISLDSNPRAETLYQNGYNAKITIRYPNGLGNVVSTWAEGNGNGINGNQIRCYNCRGEGHYASNYTIKRVNANFTLKDNLQQASTSGTQTDKAPVYDSNGSAEVHHSKNCYDNDIFNMFTQEEQYTELLEPIPEPHQVQQNVSNVISAVSRVDKSEEIVEQQPANVEETQQCLTKNINALHLSSGKQITTLNEEISNLSKQLSTEKSTVSSLLEEKKKLKSDFKIREDELLDKQIQLENKIKELDNILVKTGQSIQTMHMLSPKPDSFYHTEQKMALGYQNPFYLKQAQRKHQCLYDGKVLLEKHDPPVVHDSEETLQLAQESRQKMKQLNKEIKPANYTKINLLSGIFVSQTAKSQEEVYVVNTSKTATVSKSISKPNEEFLDDTTLSVARKFLNEVRNYEKEIAHLKTTYKNLFDSISVTRAQTKTIIDSLQHKLHDTIYENAKLRAQLFDKVSDQVDTTKGVDNTAKTRRPQPRSNTKNDRVPSAFKRVVATRIKKLK